MALTEQQEKVLVEIIEAYGNGKRLSDLPDVKGTNPMALLCEVLDEDGESKKAAVASLLPYLEEDCSYGIEFDTEVSSPTCVRIGNSDLHRRLPVQSRMRGCLLDDDGRVVEYLNPQDWRGNVLDGSRGQVMVEIPMHYRKFETDGTKRRVRLSELPLAGYHVVPKAYVSAYEATVERSTLKLASVKNVSAEYRGGNNNADWDGGYRSLLGKAATSLSRTQCRNYARKRKEGSVEWNCLTYGVYKSLYWLFVVEYATLNSQLAFNAEPTDEGYRQGGLGEGVTNINGDKWNAFNSYYPFIPCGYTDALGNGSGEVEYVMPTDYDSENQLVVKVNRYRGIENPFGHIFKWADGINIRISANVENGGDGESRVMVCDDPASYVDNGYDNYRHVGNAARVEGYVKKVIFGEEGDIVVSEVGGGSSIYHCDNSYTNVPASGESLRGALFGGYANSGAIAGLACVHSSSAPSLSRAYFGSRLCFNPR